MKALAAEMVANFGRRLEPLGIQVKELTGDMQLTKTEIMKTQVPNYPQLKCIWHCFNYFNIIIIFMTHTSNQ